METTNEKGGGHDGQEVSRRLFLRKAVLGSVAAWLASMGGAFTYLFWPQKVGAFGSKMVVGKVEDFPLGSVTTVRDGKFHIVHVPEGLLAIYWKCTHLGCTVPWVGDEEFQLPNGEKLQGVFHCFCHGSIFTPTGQVVAGPAPRPQDLMELTIEGGKVVVDTGKIIQRERWDPSQAVKV